MKLRHQRMMRSLADQFGFDFDETANGHARFTSRTTGKVFFGSGTPSDARGWKNMRADFKRFSQEGRGP